MWVFGPNKRFRMSARQGHYLAQISLGRFLAETTLEPKLRNPIEAYAWWIAAGATKSANKLLATFSQSDANAAKQLVVVKFLAMPATTGGGASNR